MYNAYLVLESKPLKIETLIYLFDEIYYFRFLLRNELEFSLKFKLNSNLLKFKL